MSVNKRKLRLDPLQTKRQRENSINSSCNSLKSFPNLENLIIRKPLAPRENLLSSHETMASMKEEPSTYEIPSYSVKNWPKEIILQENGLVFLDLLTMNTLNAEKIQEIQYEMGFFKDFLEKTNKRIKFLIVIPINESVKLQQLQNTLDSLYKNLKIFEETGYCSLDSFCFMVFFNGISAVSLENSSFFFDKQDNTMQIPFVYTFQARKLTFLEDLQRFLDKQPAKQPIDSAYLYEVDYSPILNNCSFTMKTLFCVKMNKTSHCEIFKWIHQGFSQLINPEFIGFMSPGAEFESENAFLKVFSQFLVNNENKLEGILAVNQTSLQKNESQKIWSKCFTKYQIFNAKKNELYGENNYFYEKKHFGIFKNSLLQENMQSFQILNEKYEGFIDFNSFLAFLAKKKVEISHEIRVVVKTTDEISHYLEEKKEIFDFETILMTNIWIFLIKSIFSAKNLTFFEKAVKIFENLLLSLKFIAKIFCPAFLFALILVLTSGPVFSLYFTSENFEMITLKTFAISFFFLFLCIIWHYSWFFLPRESLHDLSRLQTVFSLGFYLFLSIFLYKIHEFQATIWIFIIFSAYFLVPIVLSGKFCGEMMKNLCFFVIYWPCEVFAIIYCFGDFRGIDEKHKNFKKLNFEKLFTYNLCLSLIFLIFLENKDISQIFFIIFFILLAVLAISQQIGAILAFLVRVLGKKLRRNAKVHVINK